MHYDMNGAPLALGDRVRIPTRQFILVQRAGGEDVRTDGNVRPYVLGSVREFLDEPVQGCNLVLQLDALGRPHTYHTQLVEKVLE